MEPSKEELYAMGERLARKLWDEIPLEAEFYGRAHQGIEKYTKKGRVLHRIPLSFTTKGIIGIINVEDVDIESGTAKLGYHTIRRLGKGD